MGKRSQHKQMAINMASSVCVFALNMCVSFFLTPFIVGKLGTAAYGFVGLSNNIINYTGLLTIAINSMSGRFITISMHKRDYVGANKYLSSIFYANLALSVIILLTFFIIAIFLPDIVNIPSELVNDVRTLFLLLGLSSCLGLITGVISISTFIRNRLDITNIRNLIGTFLRVTLLLLLFGFFVPHLWYLGVSALVMGLYTLSANYYFFRILTPELAIRSSNYNWTHLKEVISAGAWNIVTKISELLSRGFDLLLANLFISAWAMGILSISQTIPLIILGFFGMICGNFSPELTRLYAINDKAGLKAEILRAIRLTSCLTCIPLSILFAYCDVFYKLWLPSENPSLLYTVTLLGSFGLCFGMPLEPIWSIFAITNKVRHTSLNLFYNSIGIFCTVLLSMFLIKDDIIRLYALAAIRSIFGSFRCVIFLPIYGSKCLGLKKTTFYPLLIKSTISIIVSVAISLLIKYIFKIDSWDGLFGASVLSSVVILIPSAYIILNNDDRALVISRMKRKLNSNHV